MFSIVLILFFVFTIIGVGLLVYYSQQKTVVVPKEHVFGKNPKVPAKKQLQRDCLLVNPTEYSLCHTGEVTNKSTFELTKNHKTLPMKLLFGDTDINDNVLWSKMHPLVPHRGCEPNDILNSPFITDCEDKELGYSLIQKYYETNFNINHNSMNREDSDQKSTNLAK
jgi:hypothetical protein